MDTVLMIDDEKRRVDALNFNGELSRVYMECVLAGSTFARLP